MPKGPRITPEVELLITEVYLEHPQWIAAQIEAEVRRKLGGKAPGLSAIQKKLAEAKKTLKKEQQRLEDPWSLGASVEFSIPFEATSDLVKAWKWCCAVGRTLTIREARWIARLRTTLGHREAQFMASKYARRERACKALGRTDIYTADLDAYHFFMEPNAIVLGGYWLFETALDVGAVRPFPGEPQGPWPDDFSLSFNCSKASTAVEDDLGLIPTVEELEKEVDLSVLDSQIKSLGDRSPASVEISRKMFFQELHREIILRHKDLPDDVDNVYALWLRRLSKGAKWNEISKKGKRLAVDCLYNEVLAELVYRQTADMPPERSWKPSATLLAEVGIEEETHV